MMIQAFALKRLKHTHLLAPLTQYLLQVANKLMLMPYLKLNLLV